MLQRKVFAIREATADQIKVTRGLGGLYMMELIPAGICGVMPGLALADILNVVFSLRKANKTAEAARLYEGVLPQIVFALQNMELFVYCEKKLLQARGVLSNARCRSASLTPDAYSEGYVNELNELVLQVIESAGLAVAKGAGS